MTTLVRIARARATNLFNLEDFVAREMAAVATDPVQTAPKAAGGTL